MRCKNGARILTECEGSKMKMLTRWLVVDNKHLLVSAKIRTLKLARGTRFPAGTSRLRRKSFTKN